jgi:HlyD family secretion protein
MKRTTIILAIVATLAVLFLGSRALSRGQTDPTAGYELATVRRGEIVATVNATGAIAPRNRAVLTFSSPGRITEIKVAVGEQVEVGQVLATIDARDLEQAVAQAEALLRMSQARLDQAKRGAAAEDIAAARANLASAEENLKRLQAGTPARDIEIARLRWEQAKDQLWGAQCQRDATCGNPAAPSSVKDQSEAAVAAASMAAEIARLQYEQAQEGAAANDIRAAEAQVAQAQSTLAQLERGPAAEEIRAAQAQVDQNAASLEQARLRLEGASLRAPFAGIVAGINGRVGEVTGAASPVITLVDLSAYHIDVDIDETAVGQVHEGQTAEITLDAFPDLLLSGVVTHVDPVGTLAQGLVNYRVTVSLDPTEAPIKADMTAGVSIITVSKQDVILVPNRAVRRDSEGRYVEVVVDGRIQRQSVEVGIANETETEIIEGLEEGMQVIAGAARQPMLPSNLFGGR